MDLCFIVIYQVKRHLPLHNCGDSKTGMIRIQQILLYCVYLEWTHIHLISYCLSQLLSTGPFQHW